MLKILFCLNRKSGMSHREFGEYWYEEHAPIVSDLPGLQRYDLAFPEDPANAAYDGVAELYFENRSDLDEAMDSPAGEAAAADLANFADTDDILQIVLDHRTIVDRES